MDDERHSLFSFTWCASVHRNDERPLIGAAFGNFGNTCFMNAVLQCLARTPPLVKTLLTYEHCNSCSRELFCAMCLVTDHIGLSIENPGKIFWVWLVTFVRSSRQISPDFVPGQQEDAHEFLYCLLDKMHMHEISRNSNSSKEISIEEDSSINRIFGGRIRSQVRCCDCGRISETNMHVRDIMLEIDNASVNTLKDALESFTEVEKMDDPENRFSCEGCNAKVSAEKQLKLSQAPQVLIIYLKRFKTELPATVKKIDKFVQYPLLLDMNPYLCSPQDGEQCNYELYAVVVHEGEPDYGHYYSFVHSTHQLWYKMDDDKVSEHFETGALGQMAYILFYIKQGSSCSFPDLHFWYSRISKSMKTPHSKEHGKNNESTEVEEAKEENQKDEDLINVADEKKNNESTEIEEEGEITKPKEETKRGEHSINVEDDKKKNKSMGVEEEGEVIEAKAEETQKDEDFIDVSHSLVRECEKSSG